MKKLTQFFKDYQNSNEVHQSTDGELFTIKGDAINHQKTLGEGEVTTHKREDFDKAEESKPDTNTTGGAAKKNAPKTEDTKTQTAKKSAVKKTSGAEAKKSEETVASAPVETTESAPVDKTESAPAEAPAKA